MKVSFDASGKPVSATGAAFLLNHEAMTRQDKTIDQMETLTGFEFFANIPTSIQDTAEGTYHSFF